MQTPPPRNSGDTGNTLPAEPVELLTPDCTRLNALRYRPSGLAKARLIVAGATGVPQRFYRAFAQFASGQGYDVLTLDYRGIGLSRPGPLRGYQMDYLDWAMEDLATAVDHFADENAPLFMVGHSFGGHAFGVLPNHHRVARFYTFATGAGWHGWMPGAERLKVWVMWNLIGPLVTRWKGYLAWSLLGMGEDLPMGVYRDWKRWCSYPRYFFDDPKVGESMRTRFAQVNTPIVAANAVDDLWAPPASRDAFMAAYRMAPMQSVTIDPQAHGLAAIGHMGYFRRDAEPLWREVLRWFGEHQPTPSRSAPAASAIT